MHAYIGTAEKIPIYPGSGGYEAKIHISGGLGGELGDIYVYILGGTQENPRKHIPEGTGCGGVGGGEIHILAFKQPPT